MRLALFIFVIFSSLAHAQRMTFRGQAEARGAAHIGAIPSPASERFILRGEQKFEFSEYLRAVVSGKGYYEHAYFERPDLYPGAMREQDSREVRLQDAFVELKAEEWMLRLGNQQVVWGESFGNVYSDFLNPKDLREGLSADFASLRYSVPMANLKYVQGSFSAQALVLPRPEFNVMPLPGSDFAPFKAPRYAFQTLQLDRERRLDWPQSDYGGRLSYSFGTTDTSLFYFDGYDRFPYYELAPDTAPGGLLHIREQHARIRTLGFALASDIRGYVLRLEVVRSQGRQIPIVIRNDIQFRKTDESIVVASVDLPSFWRLNVSVMGATSELALNYPYLLRKTREPQGGVRASLSLFSASSLDAQFLQSFAGQGNHAQGEFMTPLTSRLELRLGFDVFGGSDDGQWGRLQGANRGYATLRYHLDGFPEPRL